MTANRQLIDPYDLTIHLAQKNAKHPLQYDDVLAVIADEKRIEAAEVVHGRWEQLTLGAICRCCNNWNNRSSNYCPNCGAKMDGGN